MNPQPHDRRTPLSLVPPLAESRVGLAALLIGTYMIVMGILSLSFNHRLTALEHAQESPPVVAAPLWPPITISCTDWQGEPFGVTLNVSRGAAEQIIAAIQQGIAPPYQPKCLMAP